MAMKKQEGVILLVCLVILLVITMLGTAAMQGAGLEFKMVKNFEERQRVFQTTEAALKTIELRLSTDQVFSNTDLSTRICTTAADCFDNTCGGGLCFLGEHIDTFDDQELCYIYDDPNSPSGDPNAQVAPDVPIWLDTTGSNTWGDVWGDAGKHNPFGDLGLSDTEVTIKYIIEFQCFIEVGGVDIYPTSAHGFYRVTARGTNSTGLTEVMLQSTLTVPMP